MTKSMRKEMRSRLHNVKDSDEDVLTTSLTTYNDLSIKLLDTCHKDDEDDTAILISRKCELFSEECDVLTFAFYTGQKVGYYHCTFIFFLIFSFVCSFVRLN